MSSDKNGFFITSGNITYKNGHPNFIESQPEDGMVLLMDENGEIKGSYGRALSPQEMEDFQKVIEKLQEALKR